MNTVLKELPPPLPDGKRRLIDAAVSLTARDGTMLSSLGLRELAREAGLNHNTFYRHFNDVADLARSAARDVAQQIMAGMERARRAAPRHADATRNVVDWFVEFVADHRDALVVGLRELHGGPPAMREIFLAVVEWMVDESVEQIERLQLAPALPRERLREVCLPIVQYMFYRARDLIDHPRKRTQIAAEMTRFVRLQFVGALAEAARA